MRAALAVLVATMSHACSHEPAEQDSVRVIGILAAHRAPEIAPSGDWKYEDGHSFQSADIVSLGSADQYFVWFTSETDGGDPTQASGMATWADGVLTLRLEPAEFDDRFHLCRLGDRELLLPEKGVWFARGQDPVPQGRIFTRASAYPERLGGYLPGPEDENSPMRRVEGD